MVERMGNPSKDEGEWIAKIDLVESGKALKLEEQEQLGKCGSECRTIQKAVEEILDNHDTDIAEKLWQGKQNRAQFANWLCYELSGACKSKAPALPKSRKPGPAFEAIDPKEAEMEKMLAGMKVCPQWPLLDRRLTCHVVCTISPEVPGIISACLSSASQLPGLCNTLVPS